MQFQDIPVAKLIKQFIACILKVISVKQECARIYATFFELANSRGFYYALLLTHNREPPQLEPVPAVQP